MENYFRCYYSNDMYKVGNVITEKEFNRVPTIFKGDFKPHKEPYEKGKYKVYKCENVDLKGYYKLNFR